MPKASSVQFKEILKNDGYTYILKSKSSERIDMNFPNLPDWYKGEFKEWRPEMLLEATVTCFEYNGSDYKLYNNVGDADCSDGNFGAVFDENNEKVLDVISSGEMETLMKSLKSDDANISDDLIAQLSPYLQYFEVVLANNTEFEYVVFKVLVENNSFLADIIFIDERHNPDSEEDNEKC